MRKIKQENKKKKIREKKRGWDQIRYIRMNGKEKGKR